MDKKVIFKTTKRELTDEIRNMSIDDIRELRFDVNKLKSLGINTFGELLQFDTEKLSDYYGNKHSLGYAGLINVISDLGFIMNDDKKMYEELNVSDEAALIPIDELALSPKLKHKLKSKLCINYLGKLLTTKWRVYNSYRFHLDDEDLIELKNYIHSLGYAIIDEEDTLTEIKRSKGNDLIEISLGLSTRLANIMYRNNIFTINDLLKYGPHIYNAFGMGEVKKNELANALKNKGIIFDEMSEAKITVEDSILTKPNEGTIDKLKQENKTILKRIERKQALLDEYNRLLQEQAKLKLIESELDMLIVNEETREKDGDNFVRR